MDIKELRNYNKWIGMRASTILDNVRSIGGWKEVFPANKEFPVWASRVRNYFNEYPQMLTLLSLQRGYNASSKVNNYRKFGFKDSIIMANSLSGDVYRDEKGRLWYEMDTAGAGYHYENRNWFEKLGPTLKAAKGKFTPQSQIPVFKLISPDRTGGSLEVCIHNHQVYNSVWQALNPFTAGTGGKTRIGSVNKWVNVETQIVENWKFKGSYNYSETVKMGLSAHDHRDVKSHKVTRNFYVDPSRWTKLENRIFPERDGKMKLILKGGNFGKPLDSGTLNFKAP